MQTVITFNANGIRSAYRKGWGDWWPTQNADYLALQEIKVQPAQWSDFQAHAEESGYRSYACFADKKGYSGVAICTRQTVLHVQHGLGWGLADTEGRYIHVECADRIIASVYFPSGTSGPHRQTEKYRFMDYFYGFLQELRAHGKPCVIAGDWNIAHTPLDLKNWKANQRHTGFLPEERAWLDKVFGELDYCDTYRKLHPTEPGYTWWSQRSGARQRNVGWRIDYQIVSPGLAHSVRAATVDPEPVFSDHAPLTVQYD